MGERWRSAFWLSRLLRARDGWCLFVRICEGSVIAIPYYMLRRFVRFARLHAKCVFLPFLSEELTSCAWAGMAMPNADVDAMPWNGRAPTPQKGRFRQLFVDSGWRRSQSKKRKGRKGMYYPLFLLLLGEAVFFLFRLGRGGNYEVRSTSNRRGPGSWWEGEIGLELLRGLEEGWEGKGGGGGGGRV